MTDRELLEKAARAAGLSVVGLADDMVSFPGRFAGGLIVRNERGGDSLWNSLTDDGDALRLAVKLGLHAKQFPILDPGFGPPLGMIEVWRVDDDDPLHVEFLRSGDDRLAATRRAIVRAAAALGDDK
jgi:hypothetical protein